MNLFELILQELEYRGVAFVRKFAPPYIASIGAHLFNIHNKEHQVFYELGRIPDMRVHIMMVAPPGFTLDPHSLVLMEDGSLKFLKDVRVGDRLASIDGRPNIVMDVRHSRHGRVLKFEPHNLRCSKTHRILTDSGWKYAKDVKSSDMLVTAYTTQQLWLFGFWLAEGRFDGKWWTPVLSNTNSDLLKRVEAMLRHSFDCKLVPAGSPAEYRAVSLSSRSFNFFARFLQRFGIYERGRGTRSSNKRIPPEMFYLDPIGKVALLQGLFTGDGHFDSSGGLLYGTSSPQLYEDVQKLLDSLGIDYTAYGCTHQYATSNLYQLRIKKHHADIFKKPLPNIVVTAKTPIYEIREVSPRHDLPYIDLDTTAEHFIANNVVVHNSKTLFIEQFLRGSQAILFDSGIDIGFESIMTEAGFVGTIRFEDGTVVQKEGAAFEYRKAIVGVEEFHALASMMKAQHSKTLDSAILTALDSGWLTKRLAAGRIHYQTFLTLWAATQPMRFDLTSGLARRFVFIVFIPSQEARQRIKQARRRGLGRRFDPHRTLEIRRWIRKLTTEVNMIVDIEFPEQLYKLCDQYNVPHFEEGLYERIAVGYEIMVRGPRRILDVRWDENLERLLKLVIAWRLQAKFGAQYAQILLAMHELGGRVELDRLYREMSYFGLDPLTCEKLVLDLVRMKYLAIEQGKILRLQMSAWDNVRV